MNAYEKVPDYTYGITSELPVKFRFEYTLIRFSIPLIAVLEHAFILVYISKVSDPYSSTDTLFKDSCAVEIHVHIDKVSDPTYSRTRSFFNSRTVHIKKEKKQQGF